MLMRSIVAGHLLQVVVSLVLSTLHLFFADASPMHCVASFLCAATSSYALFLNLPSLACTLHCRDNLVAQSKESKVSAAVVFLPQNTLHFGKCGSDKCYCVEVGISSLL